MHAFASAWLPHEPMVLVPILAVGEVCQAVRDDGPASIRSINRGVELNSSRNIVSLLKRNESRQGLALR